MCFFFCRNRLFMTTSSTKIKLHSLTSASQRISTNGAKTAVRIAPRPGWLGMKVVLRRSSASPRQSLPCGVRLTCPATSHWS